MRKTTLIFLLGIWGFHLFAQKIPEQLIYEDLNLIDGSVIDAEKLKGKVLVVNLWGTWCKPCIEEIPDLNELVEHYDKSDDVMFISVASQSFDDAATIKKFLEKRPFNFHHIIPVTKSMFFEQIGKVSYPTTVIFDKEGALRKKYGDAVKPKQLVKLKKMVDELIAS